MKKPKIAIVGLGGQSIFLNVDHFHQKEETLVAQQIYVEPGGKGYNQAVAAARLGADVSFLSAVGEDSYALECKSQLIKENIRPYLVTKKQENTALATILTNKHGENQVTVFPGAKLEISDVDLFAEEIKTADFVLLQNEVPDEVNHRVIELAKESNVPVIFNPAPVRKIKLEDLTAIALVTPNEMEAKELFCLSQEASLEELKKGIVSSGIKNVIVTMADEGSLAYANQEFTFVPSRKVKAVDTTGAGDAFTAGVSVRLALGDDLIQAAKYATLVASMSVQKAHVLASYPTADQVFELLRNEK